MPSLEAVNAHRAEMGKEPLSAEEFSSVVMPPTPPDPPPVDERTIKIRMGLIDPNEE